MYVFVLCISSLVDELATEQSSDTAYDSYEIHNSLHDEDRTARKERARVEIKKNNLQNIVDNSQCREQKGHVVSGCSTCRTETSADSLKRCARCQLVWYCSRCALRRNG